MADKNKALYQMRKELVMMDSFIETLLDEVGDAVYYQDGDLVYRFFNEDYLALVNKTEDEVHGHNIFNVFPKEEAEVYNADDLDVLKRGVKKSYEATIEHHSGSKIIIQVIKRPHIDETGKVIGIFGIIKDVTETRENQRHLDMIDKVKKVFLDINRDILTHKSEHDFFDNIQLEIQSVFEQCEQSTVLVIDQSEQMKILVHRGYIDKEADGFMMPLSESYFSKHNGEDYTSAFYVNDVEYYLGKNDIPIITSEEDKPVKSSLCIPLWIKGRLMYIISIDSTVVGAFNETDRLVAEFISKELPIIYRIFELHQETLKLSKYDGLTELYNRRTYNHIVDRWLKKYKENTKISLVIMDLDKLKKINDKFGHPAGDKYITELVAVVKEVQNDKIKFGRIGGDEFAGIFMDYEEEEVGKIMKKISKDFSARPIGAGEYFFNGSFSYGIANYHEDGENRSELMKIADIRMYQHK